MKYIPILFVVALLLSCGEQHRRPKATKDREYIEKTHYTRIKPDIMQASSSTPDEEVSSQTNKATRTYKSVNHSSTRSFDDDYDNMRGFDPASENDMDDNGMSRYMENNDDEGWD